MLSRKKSSNFNGISLKDATNNQTIQQIRSGHIQRMIEEFNRRIKADMVVGNDNVFFNAEDYIDAYKITNEELDEVLIGYARIGWKSARLGKVLYIFRPEADSGYCRYDVVFNVGGILVQNTK